MDMQIIGTSSPAVDGLYYRTTPSGGGQDWYQPSGVPWRLWLNTDSASFPLNCWILSCTSALLHLQNFYWVGPSSGWDEQSMASLAPRGNAVGYATINPVQETVQLIVTGTITPDATGIYQTYGSYNGATLYKSLTGNWWIFMGTPDVWYITDNIIDGEENYDWGGAALDISGETDFPALFHTLGTAIVNPYNGDVPAAPAMVFCSRSPAKQAKRLPPRSHVTSTRPPGTTPIVLAPPPQVFCGRGKTRPRPPLRSRMISAPTVAAMQALPTPQIIYARPPVPRRTRVRSRATTVAAGFTLSHFYVDARGLYRIFNAAGYRFYWSQGSPPAAGSTPQATSASLPYATTATFADGTWYLSVSYFNGVLDSGFLPLGPAGETWLRLDLAGGAVVGSPPDPPLDWQIAADGGGAARISAACYQADANRATAWSISYTTDGSTPAANQTSTLVAMPPSGLAVLDYDLPAAAAGATVKVRLQTAQNDGTADAPIWVFSAGSTVQSITIAAAGPTAPAGGVDWPGAVPIEERQ